MSSLILVWWDFVQRDYLLLNIGMAGFSLWGLCLDTGELHYLLRSCQRDLASFACASSAQNGDGHDTAAAGSAPWQQKNKVTR